jgi:NAD(P)-dependent dehydrogenase (short-subunit alcohol dehydrogenase family)
VARRQALLTEAKEVIEVAYPGVKVVTHAVSVTDFNAVNKIMELTGTIDILVLNAGVLPKPQPALDLEPDDLAKAFEVNVFGPLNMIQAFTKLPRRDSHTARTILYTSAYGVNFVHYGVSAYNTSKTAMTYLMRCIDEEYADTGVRSFAFHPCVAYTSMARYALALPPDAMEWDSREYSALWKDGDL